MQKPVHDLKCCVSLARASRHHQQQSVLPARNRIYRFVDCNALVVSGRVGRLAAIIRLGKQLVLLRRDAGFLLVARNKFHLSREFVHADLALFARQEIVLRESIAVGTIRKRQIEHLRIRHRLLQAVRNAVRVVFRLHHSNRVVGIQIQQIIHALRRLTEGKVSLQVDPSIGDLRLHRDFILAPLHRNRRRDALKLDVLFAHQVFGQHRTHAHLSQLVVFCIVGSYPH